MDLFDESYIHFSEDLDINCRLALAGCQFGGIDRCLNYRRFHANRVIRNTRQRLEGSVRALDKTFADPRTPPEVQALKGRAYANNYVVWGVEALHQFDTATGLEFLATAVQYLPELLAGTPNELTVFLMYEVIFDETADHPKTYREIVAQLPADKYAAVHAQMEWGIGRAWLVKAYRALIWGSREEGRAYLHEAVQAGACRRRPIPCATSCTNSAATRSSAAPTLLMPPQHRLDEEFKLAMPAAKLPSLASAMRLAQAFEHYNAGQNEAVPSEILRAFRMDPRTMLNRGALSILVRSAMQTRLGAE